MKKRKRRMGLVLCCALFLLLLIQPTYAYDLDELEMSIDILGEYTPFTRDMSADDPNYELYGFNKADADSLMEDRNIYLDALTFDGRKEILITKYDGFPKEYRFDMLSDEEMSDALDILRDTYTAAGLVLHEQEIYEGSQIKFLKTCFSQEIDGQVSYEIQYYTVFDEKAISVALYAVDEISEEDAEEFQRMVDSIDFWTLEPAAEEGRSTQAFLYTDAESGVSFTVPANWTQEPMNKPRKYLDAKFVSNSGDGYILYTHENLYGSEEAQSLREQAEEYGLSREDIVDILALSKADAVEMFGVEESEVTIATYGGKEYFSALTTTSETAYGLDVLVRMTNLVRYENGHLYMFSFGGDAAGPRFKEFEALMSSVKYPEPILESAGGTNGEDGTDIDFAFTLGVFVGSLIGTAVIYTLPIAVYRYAVAKKPVNRKKAKRIVIIYGICVFIVMLFLAVGVNGKGSAGGAIFLWSWVNYRILTSGKDRSDDAGGVPPVEPVSTSEKTFCHECGARVPAESDFCHRCGAAIWRG